MLIQPLLGYLADRIGTRTNMLLFGGLSALFVIPILMGIQATRNPYTVFFLVVAGLAIAGFYTPVTGVMKADLYPASVRALGVGFPYAVGNALCGGTAEYVALMLRSMGVEQYFFYYVSALGAVTFIAAAMLPDLRKHGYLDGDGAVEDNVRLGVGARGIVRAPDL
jgi:MHS family alpha-ketoglutarate permease-like MFS transporter